jgi:hypothetical protein
VAFLLILDVLPSLGHSGGRRRSFVRYGNFTTWNPGGEHSGQYLRGLPALRSISNISPHNAQHRCTITSLVYRIVARWTPLRGEREIGVLVSSKSLWKKLAVVGDAESGRRYCVD